MMDSYGEIRHALEVLGLPTMVTRSDIKRRYRQLVRQYHPDRRGDSEEMERINRAYELLMEYVEQFRFRFDEEEVARYHPQGQHARQFTP